MYILNDIRILRLLRIFFYFSCFFFPSFFVKRELYENMEIILGYDRIAWSVRCKHSRWTFLFQRKRFSCLIFISRARESKIYRCRDPFGEGRNTVRNKLVNNKTMSNKNSFSSSNCALNLRTKIGNL